MFPEEVQESFYFIYSFVPKEILKLKPLAVVRGDIMLETMIGNYMLVGFLWNLIQKKF